MVALSEGVYLELKQGGYRPAISGPVAPWPVAALLELEVHAFRQRHHAELADGVRRVATGDQSRQRRRVDDVTAFSPVDQDGRKVRTP